VAGPEARSDGLTKIRVVVHDEDFLVSQLAPIFSGARFPVGLCAHCSVRDMPTFRQPEC
jgi:hypothetical protein